MPTNHHIQPTTIISAISHFSLHFMTLVGVGAATQHGCHGSDHPSSSCQLHHSHNTHKTDDTDVDKNANQWDVDTELTYCPFPSAQSIPISDCPPIASLTHLVYFQWAASYLSDLSVLDLPELDPCKRCLREKFLWQFQSKKQRAWVMEGDYQRVPNIETHTLPASPFPFWISSPHHDSVVLHLPRSLRPSSSFSDLPPTHHSGNHSQSGSYTDTIIRLAPGVTVLVIVGLLLYWVYENLRRPQGEVKSPKLIRQSKGKAKQEQMEVTVGDGIATRTRAKKRQSGR